VVRALLHTTSVYDSIVYTTYVREAGHKFFNTYAVARHSDVVVAGRRVGGVIGSGLRITVRDDHQ
jgi:hypothetical protein